MSELSHRLRHAIKPDGSYAFLARRASMYDEPVCKEDEVRNFLVGAADEAERLERENAELAAACEAVLAELAKAILEATQ